MRRRLQSAADRSARSRKKNDPSMFANQKKVTLLYVCCFFLFNLALHLNMNEGNKRQPKADKRNMKICYKHFPSR